MLCGATAIRTATQQLAGRGGLVPGAGILLATVMALLPMIGALQSERWLGIPIEWLLVVLWIGLGAALRQTQRRS